jgi:RHS repeat-associated protein
VVEYTYNGLNQQIGRHADLDADGDVDSTDKWEWTIYDPRWRRVATYMVAGGTTISGSADSDPKERYVHHAAGRSGGGSYLDSVILRDRDQTAGNNGVADGTLEQRLYYGQNWRADTVVLMTGTGRILERLTYSAYGVATRHPVADFNRDGFTDFFDDLAYDDCFTGSGGGCPSGQTADLNLDGVADMFDYDEWDLSYAEQVNTARGVLSQTDASAAVSRIGYAGYWFEPSTQTYLVRNREYDPNVGTWDERDPMGYHDGADLYMYVRDNPVTGRDPMGLRRQRCNPGERCGEIQQLRTYNCPSELANCWSDPRVVSAVADVRQHCSCMPNIECHECVSSTTSGYVLEPTWFSCGSVHLCLNSAGDFVSVDICGTLAHELIHIRQNCQHGGTSWYEFCEDRICMEYEAYNSTSRVCDEWWRYRYDSKQSCVCALACGSVPATCNLLNDCRQKCMRFIDNQLCKDGEYLGPWIGPARVHSR